MQSTSMVLPNAPFDVLQGRGENGAERIVDRMLRRHGAQDMVSLGCGLERLWLRYQRPDRA